MARLLSVQDLVIEARSGSGWVPIVNRVSFCVAPGEVTALIGESGSGKTTIALSALGHTRPGCRHAGGRVLLGETPLFELLARQRRQLRGARVAYVAQSAAAAFNPALTIGEQVTEPAVLHGILKQDLADTRAAELFRILDLPTPERIGQCYPHQVSGGQLQRAMIAMALCANPDLLVLDEPTTALDVTTQIEVLRALKNAIVGRRTAALYVSHDLAVVAQIADRIVVLSEGRVQEEGAADDVINRPRHAYTRRLLSAVRTVRAEDKTTDRDSAEAPLLEVRGITAGYGLRKSRVPAVIAVRDLSLKLGRGETIGIIGESGSGKSSLARVIAGLLPAAQGEILLSGKPLPSTVHRRRREDLRRVQIVFQTADTVLNPRQRVAEILGRPLAFYGRASVVAQRQRIADLLALVELPSSFASRYPPELSGGQKQRVNLARALAAEPELVLCDEVTSALDTIVGAAIIDLLKRLQRELGVSYLFISHDLSTVATMADAILVLYAGRTVESGSTSAVLRPPFHPYTRLLLSSVPELRIGWLEQAFSRLDTAPMTAPSARARGCPFFDRCPLAIAGTCDLHAPPLRHAGPGHYIACWRELSELAA
jgi:peptide/nickel transport system ATP-binding protein